MNNKTSILKNRVQSKTIRIIIICVILVGVASTWQRAMSIQETENMQPPGKIITVRGHKMHLYAKGRGTPKVVLTVGSGTPCSYTDYYYVQEELQKITRTITYDRVGFGWSEAAPMPDNVDDQVKDLHELLNKAGEKPPYILVGHSLSSLEVIRYAQLYPEEVESIVLIDGGNPFFYAEYSETSALAFNYILGGLRKTGLLRALGAMEIFPPIVGESERHKNLPEEVRKIDEAMFYNKVGSHFNREALRNINENAQKVIEGGDLKGIPLVILTADGDKKWIESQEKLKAWSKNSQQETIQGAGHYIHWSHKEKVISRIEELIVDSQNKE